MDDQAAQRDGREGEGGDPAELIPGLDPVAPFSRSCVVLLGAGVNRGQVILGCRQLRAVEIARQHSEAIAPPRGRRI
jgi:hypothetical protein